MHVQDARHSWCLVVWLAASACGGAQAAPPDFDRDVKPILARHCISCHGPAKQKGGLRLDRRAEAAKGGDSGAAIVPGKPKESLLLERVSSTEDDERMPQAGAPLSPGEKRTLAAWIEAGAQWPVGAAGESAHWAFQPVKRGDVPAPGGAVMNPVDAFIRAKLSSIGLKPSAEADRRTLIRRLKFDLLGLPPAPEEVAAFVADPSPRAYEALVDRYLASPHFGERWARHWLDVVRFAESNGFETNQPRRNAWHYRDWVIRSLNDDLPYDRFVRAQLAGDTIGADAATGYLVAGAWDEVKSPDITLTLQQRSDELHDMISTTGSAFLGLTVGCARCHAHKFDPIPQVDYYRFQAVFAGVQHGERPIRTADGIDRAKEADRLRAQLTALESLLSALEPLADPAATVPRRPRVNPRGNIERFRPIRAKYLRFLVLESNSAEPCIDELEIFTAGARPENVAAGAGVRSSGDYRGSPAIHRLEFVNDGKYGNSRSWISNQVGRGRVTFELAKEVEIDRVAWARDREGRYVDRLATRYRIDVSTDGVNWVVAASSDDRLPASGPSAPRPRTGIGGAAVQAVVMETNRIRKELAEWSRAPMAYVGRLTAPEPTFRLHRGDPLQKREPVGPGTLTNIGNSAPIAETASDAERRAALASWIVDPANPLTARVIVNRIWQHHFGTGLVDTPSDFGKNGGTPSHPKLLDWFASELVKEKWSMKHIHRLIVTSATYRQSSSVQSEGQTKDAQSRLLWRYPRRRLEAEALRDSVLFVSGRLDMRMGGPGFDLFEPNSNYVKVYTPKKQFGPAEFRRMIYQHKPRMQLDDTFGVFDCPDGGQIAPRRNVSTTPLQALNLLNSPFMIQQAGFLADRVQKEAGAAVGDQVKGVFRHAFQRDPDETELAAAEALVHEHGLAALCRAVLNANEFVFVD